MTFVRPYKDSDFETICSWWREAGSPAPLPGMMVEDGTFVLERDDKPILCLTVLLTQSSIAYFEGFIANPRAERKKDDAAMLWDHCLRYARRWDCNQVYIYAAHEKVAKRYEELGMTRALDGLVGLVRSL